MPTKEFNTIDNLKVRGAVPNDAIEVKKKIVSYFEDLYTKTKKQRLEDQS